MANEHRSPNWLDLTVQARWYKLRREFEHELRAATDETRRDYGVDIKLDSATITSDGDRSVLRVPVSASWRGELEQAIAALLISDVEEDELRVAAIAHGIAELLNRWVERDVPVGASPEFCYPEAVVRWPDEPESRDATAQAATAAANATPVTPGAPPPDTPPEAAPSAGGSTAE